MPRFLSLALLALCAAPAFAADAPAPVLDTRIITAAQMKSVTDFLVEKDEAFRISFFCGVGEQACTGKTYNTLIFWACDGSGANRTAVRANSVNKGKVFGRSYIDTDGKACVEQEVVTGIGGISYEAMDIYYAGFTDMRTRLPQYYE
jgi:hypothetical protein